MTDQQTLAPVASDEVVPTEAVKATAPEAVDSTQGQEHQPAEEQTPEDAQADADAKAEEQKSKSADRRERRKAEQERLRTSEADAVKRATDAEAALEAAKIAAQNLPRPKQADYPDFDEYQAALSAFKMTQAFDDREMQRLEAQAKAHFAEVDQVKAQKGQEAAQSWTAQVAEARDKYSDFEAVALSDSNIITSGMADVILQTDVAADITYFLGQNPQIGAEIAKLDTINMARAIGRLEAQVSAPKPKTATDAPAPIAPIRGKATATKSPENMSMSEYKAYRAGKS